MKMDLTKLRAIQKELSVLSKVKRIRKTAKKDLGSKRKASKKRPSPAQEKARKEFAMRVRRGDFR